MITIFKSNIYIYIWFRNITKLSFKKNATSSDRVNLSSHFQVSLIRSAYRATCIASTRTNGIRMKQCLMNSPSATWSPNQDLLWCLALSCNNLTGHSPFRFNSWLKLINWHWQQSAVTVSPLISYQTQSKTFFPKWLGFAIDVDGSQGFTFEILCLGLT